MTYGSAFTSYRFDGCAERAFARSGGMRTGASSLWKPPVTLAPPSVVGVPRPSVCAIPGRGKDVKHGLCPHYMDKHGLTVGQPNQAVEAVQRAAAAVRAAAAASEEARAPAPASSSPSELGRCGTFGCTLLDGHTGLCNTGLHARSEEEIFMKEISEIHAQISDGATASPSTDDLPELEDRVLGDTVRDFWTTL